MNGWTFGNREKKKLMKGKKDGWMDGWMMDGWMNGWMMDGWLDGWMMDGWMDG